MGQYLPAGHDGWRGMLRVRTLGSVYDVISRARASMLVRLPVKRAARRRCALSELDPSAPEGHVALAGALAESRKLLEKLAGHWDRVDDKERERLHRDRVLLDVASGAREKRLKRAWEALTDGEFK